MIYPDPEPDWQDTDFRTMPNAGELWEFDNGKVGFIVLGADRRYAEIAVTNLKWFLNGKGKHAFKFNHPNDPMPIRRIEPNDYYSTPPKEGSST